VGRGASAASWRSPTDASIAARLWLPSAPFGALPR
jgi:hypothetical protein